MSAAVDELMVNIFGKVMKPASEVGQWVYAAHGFRPGEVACGCGWAYDLSRYPKTDCPECGAAFPRRCRGIMRDDVATTDARGYFVALMEPRECGEVFHDAETREGHYAQMCGGCVESLLTARVAFEVAQHIPPHLMKFAREFRSIPERAVLEDVLRSWFKGKCRTPSGKTSIYVHGNTGIGKSVAMAWAAAKAVGERAVSGHSIQWLYESELIDAAKTMYRDDSDGAKVIKRAATAKLLVIEELFSRSGPIDPTHRASGWTEHSSRTVAEILCRRFESDLPTLMTSNEPPAFDAVFDNRVKSRFAACGIVVNVHGPDLREQAVTL